MDARSPAPETQKPNTRTRLGQTVSAHPYATAAIAIAIVVALGAALAWWLHARHFESTDDAFIDAQQARIEEAKKQIDQAQGALTFARAENKRYQELLGTGTGTEQRAQQAASDLQQREGVYAAAEANAIAADKQLAVLKTQRDA